MKKPMTYKFTYNELDEKLMLMLDRHLSHQFKTLNKNEDDLMPEFGICERHRLSHLKLKWFPQTMERIKNGYLEFQLDTGKQRMILARN